MAMEKEAASDFNKTMTRIAQESEQFNTRQEQANAAAQSLPKAKDTINRAVSSSFHDRTGK